MSLMSMSILMTHKTKELVDGDLIKVFSIAGSFIAQAHLTSAMGPNMLYMYHGWDPMMFKE